ncbi:SAM-dependent methyltransferase [Kibdelosporangium lantanae]|uniref:SAM-dependent methyltransferase n=1 Tax=Kibdelosporangium lantanae TaxID=1497396 RepID=A0ABW3M4K4_9PSEU
MPATASGDGQAVGSEVSFADEVGAVFADAATTCDMSLCAILRGTSDGAASGIDQFVDLGCGFPTPKIGTVHRAAKLINSAARTFSVDHNPRAVAETLLLTVTDPNAVVVEFDITRVEELIERLTSPSQPVRLDPDRPMVVILGLVVHLMDDRTTTRVLKELYSWMPTGSRMVLTTPTSDTKGRVRDEMRALVHLYRERIGVTWYLREVTKFLECLPVAAEPVQPWELHPEWEPHADLTDADRLRLYNANVAVQLVT